MRTRFRTTAPNQRGDTLIEVTLALAILATVLTSAYVITNRAYLLGQASRERSELVNEAQQQSEALKTFRDTHTWREFEFGGSGYNGVTIRYSSIDCDNGTPLTQYCFHMERVNIGGYNQWVPVQGPGTAAVFNTKLPGTYFAIKGDNSGIGGCDPGPRCHPSYRFRVSYGADRAGANLTNNAAFDQNKSALDVWLTDLEDL